MRLDIGTVVVMTFVAVIHGQNQAPSFTDNLYSRLVHEGIKEDTPIGTEVGCLQAVDPDGDAITYSSSQSNTLKVWPDGCVELLRELDNENLGDEEELAITFFATDTFDNVARADLIISVTDVNDNAPFFNNKPYSAEIPESSVIGSLVFTNINIWDADSGNFADMSVICLPNDSSLGTCDTFDVQATRSSTNEHEFSAVITLLRGLNFEDVRDYTMAIQATDNPNGLSSNQQKTKVNIAISVQDEQDTLPSFVGGVLTINVLEHSPIGETSVLWTLQARDGDQGNPNPLRIYAKDPKNLFRIGDAVVSPQNPAEYSAQVYVNGDIDREVLQDRYEFDVTAVEVVDGVDTNATVDSYVIVSIRDRNDNIPQFSESYYRVDVTEMDTENATQINGLNIFVSDEDHASNARFDVSIIQQQGSIFAVYPRSGIRRSLIAVQVIQPLLLDYEEPAYRQLFLTLQANEADDVTRSSTAIVEINLLDRNDNSPEFLQTSYLANIREDLPVGSLVTDLISAVDKDSGDNGRVKYSLQGVGSTTFHIDEDTGVVTLAEPVDYEAHDIYEIIVVARDMASPPREKQERFTIIIQDYNDAGPVFNPATYNTQIRESSTDIVIPVKIQAVDPEDPDGVVTYTIVGGNTFDRAFVVDLYSGELSLTRTISYEETPDKSGSFQLIVQATDSDIPRQSTNTTIIVAVIDENNKIPDFVQDIYTETISELTQQGQTVVTVSATDDDSGSNGKIEYYIAAGSVDHFAIDPINGDIFISDRSSLDVDVKSTYNIIVHARDKGRPSNTGTCTVIINLTDANNKMPYFDEQVYLGNVQENQNVGVSVITVSATDPDTGSSLEYSIVSTSFAFRDKDGMASTFPYDPTQTFSINTVSGQIQTAMRLFRDDAAEISFKVKANDINSQTGSQTGTASVIITVLGSVDTAIHFIGVDTLTLPEQMSVNSKIFFVVANDGSTGETIRDYRKVPSSDPDDRFEVRQATGDIYLKKVMNYDPPDIDRKFSFQVQALSDDFRSAVQTITVFVTDINDNAPTFYQSIYDFEVRESLRYPSDVGSVIASDIDSGSYADIVFSLHGQGADNFRIFESGMIIVNEGVILDRETTPQYLLTVKAKDNPRALLSDVSKEGTVLVSIKVTDENDNCPEFQTVEPYSFYTVESSPTASTVGLILANDRDEASNGNIQFSIVNATHEGALFFGIRPYEGIIYTQTVLRGASFNSPYKVTVRAADQGIPACSSDTIVTIHVSSGQQSDGRPIWNYPSMGEVVYVMEHSEIGTYVARAMAYPQTQSSHILYSFLRGEEYLNKFSIDSLSGNITVAGDLDREKQEVYDVIILAVDALNTTRQSTRLLTIRLEDKNDETPSFNNCPGLQYDLPEHVQLYEEQQSGVFVFQVKACDLDKNPDYNSIYYERFIDDTLCNSSAWHVFSLNALSGEILTNDTIDREQMGSYLLCVEARSTQSNRRKRQIVADDLTNILRNRDNTDEVLYLLVEIMDINDNGPSFGEPPTSVIYKLPLEEAVTVVKATDPDADPNNRVRYSIEKTIFTVFGSGQDISFRSAFGINEDTGMITINYPSYTDFGEGYFTITVKATDIYDSSKFKLQDLRVYVADSLNRIKITIDMPPDSATVELEKMMDELGYAYKTSEVTFNRLPGGSFDKLKTDICLVILSEGKILSAKPAIQILEDNPSVLSAYTVSNPQTCDPDSSEDIEGWDVLWWVLVAFAIFIFFVCLVLIILICVLHKNYTSYMVTQRTYLVPQ